MSTGRFTEKLWTWLPLGKSAFPHNYPVGPISMTTGRILRRPSSRDWISPHRLFGSKTFKKSTSSLSEAWRHILMTTMHSRWQKPYNQITPLPKVPQKQMSVICQSPLSLYDIVVTIDCTVALFPRHRWLILRLYVIYCGVQWMLAAWLCGPHSKNLDADVQGPSKSARVITDLLNLCLLLISFLIKRSIK